MGDLDEPPPPPETDVSQQAPTTTAEQEPEAQPLREPSGMSWWTRSWVTLGVLIAIGVTASGILLVRHVLDHSVDPKAVAQRTTDRLATLDPVLTGFSIEGTDVSQTVGCGASGSCASATRHFRPSAHTTAAALRDATDAWAAGFGMGSASAAGSRSIRCGTLTSAPVGGPLCDVITYQIPGDEAQHVHVYAQLTADGKHPSTGTFSRDQVAGFGVGSVYVQVLGTISGS